MMWSAAVTDAVECSCSRNSADQLRTSLVISIVAVWLDSCPHVMMLWFKNCLLGLFWTVVLYFPIFCEAWHFCLFIENFVNAM